jgi:formate-dependent phosphoribosylglycinamide formyltransferase (GAR transformylase)
MYKTINFDVIKVLLNTSEIEKAKDFPVPICKSHSQDHSTYARKWQGTSLKTEYFASVI